MSTTVVCTRAPGMTMLRIPIATTNVVVALRTAALLGLAADRHVAAQVYDPADGEVILSSTCSRSSGTGGGRHRPAVRRATADKRLGKFRFWLTFSVFTPCFWLGTGGASLRRPPAHRRVANS